ncbi:MAG: alpha/beta hydrolase-fold protein [Candidatus Bathyarchaeota archaeon]|nr:alpha/beta hydrolase-fold protein [Candidatus Bathyarchaeota archaeon]
MVSVKIGESFTIDSKVLDERRECIISLPESYIGSEKKYPVLYILDAEYTPFYEKNLFSFHFMRVWEMVPEMIVVGIKNTIRNRDMIPVKLEDRPEAGGADRFLEFITEELQPTINKEYRTTGSNHIYGGSNAGLFVLYAMLNKPELFSGVISSSPMIGWCEELIHSLAEKSFNEHRYDNRLYMIYGKDDFKQVVETIPAFTDYLMEHAPDGLKWELKYLPDEGHVPFTSIYDGLKFLFPKQG